MLKRREKVGIAFEFPNIFGFIMFLVMHPDLLFYLNPFTWHHSQYRNVRLVKWKGARGGRRGRS